MSKGREGFISIGFSEGDVPLNRLVGWESKSYGYHGDDGNIFEGNGRGRKYGPTFTAGACAGTG